jgi:hypothetical protein
MVTYVVWGFLTSVLMERELITAVDSMGIKDWGIVNTDGKGAWYSSWFQKYRGWGVLTTEYSSWFHEYRAWSN